MTCQCRKGATCAEHLEQADLSLPNTPRSTRRPWWWLLAAPFYVVAGLVRFLRGDQWGQS